MPRNKQGGSLASYFYDAAGDGSGAPPRSVQSVSTNARAAPVSMATTPGFLQAGWKNGVWTGPGAEPPGGPPKAGKRRRTRSKKTKPTGAAQEMSDGMKRHQAKVDAQNKVTAMKKHFRDTELLLEQHASWPHHAVHEMISDYINHCKKEIASTRTATGVGSHKINIEAVHSHKINVGSWKFNDIYAKIKAMAEKLGIHNHLQLSEPLHRNEGDGHMYVNVVMAWLFAAKRQLMSNLAKFIVTQEKKTAEMEKFLEHNRLGIEARTRYKADKHYLGLRTHAHPYHLQDRDLLSEQHAHLYPAV